jgi:hypothetical protein
MDTTKRLSVDEEMLMWTSYRYCIGRKTYVNSLASYIGRKYYHLMSDDQCEHAANDIRECIADCLRYGHPAFEYDGTIPHTERNVIVDYTNWLNEHVSTPEDLYHISKVICYKDGYNDKYPKKYDVHRNDREWKHVYDDDIDNLLVWEMLASLFNKKKHKMVTISINGEEQTFECFEIIEKATIPCEDNPHYLKNVAWGWKVSYMPVERFLERGEYGASLNDEYIINVV